MLFFIDKSKKTSVTDMNFLERQMLYCEDDIRSLYSLPNPRFDSSRNAGSLGIPFSGRVARATFWSAPAVDLHGLRSTDLARWSAGYRRMPQRQARGPLPSGFSGTRGQIHPGLHRTLQILSVHPFEKIALHELLMKNEFRKLEIGDFKQMELFDL